MQVGQVYLGQMVNGTKTDHLVVYWGDTYTFDLGAYTLTVLPLPLELSGPTPGVYSGEVDASFLLTPVPEPSTYLAGALLAIPFGVSAVRRFRKA